MNADEPVLVFLECDHRRSRRLAILASALVASLAVAALESYQRVLADLQMQHLQREIARRCDAPDPGEIVVCTQGDAGPVSERYRAQRPRVKG